MVRRCGFFSVLLPIISDHLSPGRIFCVEGGVSSAVAAFRAPARPHVFNQAVIETSLVLWV